MNQKGNQRITLTKRLLREALLRLLSQKDIQQISVKELCEDAGINRTTFYNHYESPYDVLSEIEDGLIEGIPFIEPTGRRDKQTFIKQNVIIWQYLYGNRDVLKLLLQNNHSESDFAEKIFRFPAIQQAMKETIASAYDSANEDLIITFFENGAYSILRRWIIEEIDKTPQEIADLFAELIRI